jgi:hypothetical protein
MTLWMTKDKDEENGFRNLPDDPVHDQGQGRRERRPKAVDAFEKLRYHYQEAFANYNYICCCGGQ